MIEILILCADIELKVTSNQREEVAVKMGFEVAERMSDNYESCKVIEVKSPKHDFYKTKVRVRER